MIAGLCESPLTFQAITVWRDELASGSIMLREVIDLETTFGQSMEADDDEPLSAALTDPVAEAPAARPALVTAGSSDEEDNFEAAARAPSGEEDEEESGNISLAAMEAALMHDAISRYGAALNPPYKEKAKGRGGWIETRTDGAAPAMEFWLPPRE
jgi:RNA polymerase primary sigma factor